MIQRGLKRLICLVRGHQWKSSSDTRIDSCRRLWNYWDSSGRPYKFECMRCGCAGRLPSYVEACPKTGPFPTVLQASFARYRQGGYDHKEAFIFSYADWPDEERSHYRKCMREMRGATNVERVQATIRSEEEMAFKVFDEIEKHATRVVGKMGLSIETLQQLWDSRGWDPESVCDALGEREWYKNNRQKEKEYTP